MEDLNLETKWLCTMRGAIPEPNMALGKFDGLQC